MHFDWSVPHQRTLPLKKADPETQSHRQEHPGAALKPSTSAKFFAQTRRAISLNAQVMIPIISITPYQ